MKVYAALHFMCTVVYANSTSPTEIFKGEHISYPGPLCSEHRTEVFNKHLLIDQ